MQKSSPRRFGLALNMHGAAHKWASAQSSACWKSASALPVILSPPDIVSDWDNPESGNRAGYATMP